MLWRHLNEALNIGISPQAFHPSMHGLLAQELQVLRTDVTVRIALDDLHDVIAQSTAYYAAKLPGLKGEGGVLHLGRYQDTPWKVAQITTVFPGALVQ